MVARKILQIEREGKCMLRYRIESSITISVEILNDYIVWAMANWDKEKQKYAVTMYLQRNDVDLLDKMEQLNYEIESDRQSIKSDLCKMITYLLDNNRFDLFINRYEYQMKCFDKGNELLESETKNV